MLAPLVLMLAASAAAPGPARDDPDALVRAGTAAIESGRFGDALGAFTRAAALRPDDASVCFGAGLAAYMLGRNELAQARFECALARKPDYLAAAVWLGDLHYRAGRLGDAIAVFEAVRQRSPGAREIDEPLARLRREYALERRFREVGSARFSAAFERAADEPLARRALERLEAAHARIGRALGLYPTSRLHVLFYTREQFDEITRLGAWTAAGYDGRIRIPLDETLGEDGELDRVLSHEYVHALVAAFGGRAVPAWMNEGLAAVLEPSGAAHLEGVLDEAAAIPRLSSLHGGFGGLPRRDAEIAYAAAARAVRLLLERRGAAALTGLLEDLSRGAPFAGAFERRMAIPYEDFEALVARE